MQGGDVVKSGWWWNTSRWAAYQAAYHTVRPEPESYKSSPLADDHEFGWDAQREYYELATHLTQVIDLTLPRETLWRNTRDSYHSLIHRGAETHRPMISGDWEAYKQLHIEANGGQPRPDVTYEMQRQWIMDGFGVLIATPKPAAAAYWIIYQDCAYYASGPSIERKVQHAVVWYSLEYFMATGIRLVELGKIDGETEKEKAVGFFKSGWGGKSVPYTIATRRMT